jgi:lysophospholipase L1-like esterase
VETIPFHFNQSSIRRVEEEINPAIRALARKWKLILVDNHRLFRDHPEWLPEIHPNEEGYKAMADNWRRALLPVLKTKANNGDRPNGIGKGGFIK